MAKQIQAKYKHRVLKRRVRLRKPYLSFTLRLVLDSILFFVLAIFLVFSLNKAFSLVKNENISFKETGNIDYRVYLKDNKFYDTPYLEKGMAYVTSLIDKIKIKYNYRIDTSVDSDIDIEYKVLGKLVIASQNNSKVFYEKEYELSKNMIDEMVHKQEYVIDRDVEIDYQYYNDLANQFKSSYAINTSNHLDVYLKVTEKNKEENNYEIKNSNQLLLRIPLSEQEINITTDNNIDTEKLITQECKFMIDDITFAVISGILILLLFMVLTSLLTKIVLVTKKERSNYDKHIRRLLMGYDRIIINVKAVPDMKDYNIIEVEDFQELVDVRDNTKEPINYHVIVPHQKCEFFVINDNNLYLHTVKAVDFDKDKDNE